MSAKTQTGGSTETEIDKTVNIVAYLDGDFVSWREWADNYFDDDYFEKNEYESNKYFVDLGDEMEEIDKKLYKKLKEYDTGEVSLYVESEVKEEYQRSHYTASKELGRPLLEEVEGENGVDWAVLSSHWMEAKRVEDDQRVLNVFSRAKSLKMLKHQSEMDPDDPFVEDSNARPALVYKVRVNSVNEEESEELSEGIIRPFMDKLAKHDEIERVRMMDCVQKKEEKGVCYNL